MRLPFLLAALLLFVVPASAMAETTAPQAKQYINALGQRAISILESRDLDEQDKVRRFRAILVDNFDIPAIGRFTLGRYWRTASEAQQAEFLSLFEEMIVSMYRQRLGEYTGQRLRAHTANVDQSGRYVMVQSTVFDPANNENVAVEWRVDRKSAKPQIVDVSVEGMSMGLTQRAEFASVIERRGGNIDGLLEQMREKYAVAARRNAQNN